MAKGDCSSPVYFLSLLILLAVSAHSQVEGSSSDESPITDKIKALWTWECVDDKCKKTLANSVSRKEGEGVTSLNVCKLFCGEPAGSLWPMPTGSVRIAGPTLQINTNNIDIESATVAPNEMNWKTAAMIHDLRRLFIGKFTGEASDLRMKYAGSSLLISVIIKDPNHNSLTLETDESYHLTVKSASSNKLEAKIEANTFFGMRHGLETLGQLLVHDNIENAFVLPAEVEISDRPAYGYRALTMDTSRNFISIPTIKRNIDAMAANKMNILHWHITDTHSFPLESKNFPNLTLFGAYSADKIYKQSEIVELVHYAKIRGVKIIPEFDAPAHVGEGWQWAPPGALLCFNEQPWVKHCVEPPCGQLNPISEDVYHILEGIYRDMFKVFEISDVFHMGGDEVHYQCWNQTSEIVEFMESKQWGTKEEGFLRLWNVFQSRALSLVKKVSGKSPQTILWTSTLTTGPLLEELLDKDQYIIQIWTTGTDPKVGELIRKGYRVIFSNYDALYLDCGFGGWVNDGNNWCSPYIPWQKLYENNPVEMVRKVTGDSYDPVMNDQILGQSAALWTEQADDQSVDGRYWPRAAALAERLWSDPAMSWRDAEYRLLHQRERLVKLGVRAEALQPQWCRQNEGECPMSN